MSIPHGGAPLDRVSLAARRRGEADQEYRAALASARAHGHTWRAIADAAGVTQAAARHIVRPRDRRIPPTGTEA